MSMNQAMGTYLLSIRGTLAPKTLENARAIHNETAGASPNIAAARSLGDLSHMVYIPADHTGASAGEFLILDIWNNIDGLNQFFADHRVQEQAGLIFSQRDPVIWAPAEGFHAYHFPAPYGKNERYVVVVRGLVRSRAEAMAGHNEIVVNNVNDARKAGDLSHEVYFRLAPPNAPEALELLAVDVWMDAAGMGQYYQNPKLLSAFGKLFAAPPTTSAWVHPAGDWVEW